MDNPNCFETFVRNTDAVCLRLFMLSKIRPLSGSAGISHEITITLCFGKLVVVAVVAVVVVVVVAVSLSSRRVVKKQTGQPYIRRLLSTGFLSSIHESIYFYGGGVVLFTK